MRFIKEHLNLSLVILLTYISILRAYESMKHKLTEINLNEIFYFILLLIF